MFLFLKLLKSRTNFCRLEFLLEKRKKVFFPQNCEFVCKSYDDIRGAISIKKELVTENDLRIVEYILG